MPGDQLEGNATVLGRENGLGWGHEGRESWEGSRKKTWEVN